MIHVFPQYVFTVIYITRMFPFILTDVCMTSSAINNRALENEGAESNIANILQVSQIF